MNQDQILGGLYGLLIGDAVGVPYEFHAASELPSFAELEMVPPQGFLRAHTGVPTGTWSDDGAQTLCLLDSLVECSQMNLRHFSNKLWAWYNQGLWAVDGEVFDVGIQTGASLQAFFKGVPPEQAGLVYPNGQGNGALMRVLPLALWHQGSDQELVQDAHTQSLITHGHIINQVVCALYCLWVREVATGKDMKEAYQNAVHRLRLLYGETSQERYALESIRPDDDPKSKGSGYVVETLQSVRIAVEEASFEAVVKKAISLGDDTDTNAAIAGGLYGVKVGLSGIPQRWYNQLRGKAQVEVLVEEWLDEAS